MKLQRLLVLALPAFGLACGGSETETAAPPPAGGLPETFYAADAPADAVDVTTLRSLYSVAKVAVDRDCCPVVGMRANTRGHGAGGRGRGRGRRRGRGGAAKRP